MAAAAEDRFERVTNLVTFLLNEKDGATFAQILAEVPGWPDGEDARRRAFERDKRVLRDEGIPLIEDKGRYRIPPEQFFLPELDLSPEEHVALRLAVAAVPVGGESAGLALHKLSLGAEIPFEATAPVVAALDEHSLLPRLHEAVNRRSVMQFRYDRADELREVEPALLLFRDGYWYVNGFDRARQAQRSFRVDRIDGDVEFGPPDAFERRNVNPEEAQARHPWLFGRDDEADEAVVEVDATMAFKAAARTGGRAVVERRDDGSVVIRMPVTNRAGFRSWIFGMLDHATVVAPPELRADVVEWLEAMQ